MKKSVYDYLDEINRINNNISHTRKIIQDRTRMFTKEMSYYNTQITQEHNKVQAIKENTFITVDFKDIILHLAEKWNVPANDIDIQYSNSYNYTTKSKFYANKNITNFNQTKNYSSNTIQFQFTIKNPLIEEGIDRELYTFELPINLNEKELDDKTFGQHITAMQYGEQDIYVFIKIDDPTSLRLKFPLKQLITTDNAGTTHLKDDFSKIIFEIAAKSKML